jgi:hypothetical protein
MMEGNSRPLKNKLYTFRMDYSLKQRLEKITELKNIKPSRFIRNAVRKAIDTDMPEPIKRPVGRPKVNKPPTVKEIRDREELQKIIKLFEQYQINQERKVGKYILELYNNKTLDENLMLELEKIMDE